MPHGRDPLGGAVHESLLRECGRAYYQDSFEAMA
jgi:hypothetical protein